MLQRGACYRRRDLQRTLEEDDTDNSSGVSRLEMLTFLAVLAFVAQAVLPWGPLLIGGPCPIKYPFSNETQFCASVGRQRAVVQVNEAAAARSILITRRTHPHPPRMKSL